MLNSEADINCNFLKIESTLYGVLFLISQYEIIISKRPSRNPKRGERKINMTIFVIPLRLRDEIPPCISAGPISPPTREWDADMGIPKNVVNQSQKPALKSPIAIIGRVTMFGSTTPFPIVFATFNSNTKSAAKLQSAARSTACFGFNTFVDTIVAIEFAASFIPFKRSKMRAITTIEITIAIGCDLITDKTNKVNMKILFEKI